MFFPASKSYELGTHGVRFGLIGARLGHTTNNELRSLGDVHADRLLNPRLCPAASERSTAVWAVSYDDRFAICALQPIRKSTFGDRPHLAVRRRPRGGAAPPTH